LPERRQGDPMTTELLHCPSCHAEARPEDRFCSRCGAELRSRDPAIASRDPAPSPRDPSLGPRIQLERFFELAVDVFVVTGPDGRFEHVNQAMSRLLGVDREVILSKPWSEFVHPDDRQRSAEENAREFALGHRTVTFENRYVDVTGGIHWMDWSAELDPETGVVYGIARDVTAQKAAVEALEEARAAADSANRAKSEFLSRMSHELRTPLNAVLGFAQLLTMNELDETQREQVEQILRGGRHLLDLIDEVMDISRIEIGAATVSVEPVQLAEVVADAISLLGPLASDRQIALRSTLTPDHAGHVLADRQRLKQVLVNFLSNAIKYTPPGSTATIVASPAGSDWLRVSVVDDGPGIPGELLGRLFSPFERIGADQTKVEGTGLGLAHSKALVERMGGRIGVESNVGEGSTFWIELMVAEPVAAMPSAAIVASDEARLETAGSVLYIEDNPSNMRVVEQALRHRPGVRLSMAATARLGMELARGHPPDLILLDQHLPDLTGAEVLQALRSDPRTSEIPVVMLSADATRRQIDTLLGAGARAYLTKPVDLRALLALVDEHLTGTRAARLDGSTDEPSPEESTG
jgi:PAS domain S-box-containing protein